MEWKYTKDELPLCYATGNWDGKKSDVVLAEDIYGNKYLAECYEGDMDGDKFFDWYSLDMLSKMDYGVPDENIAVRWIPIPF